MSKHFTLFQHSFSVISFLVDNGVPITGAYPTSVVVPPYSNVRDSSLGQREVILHAHYSTHIVIIMCVVCRR